MPNLAREPESFRCPNCAEWINTEAILCRFCHCGISSEHFEPCTFCAEMVRKDATRCRYCQSDLPEAKPRTIDMRPFEPRVIKSSPEPEPWTKIVNMELIDERADHICALVRKDSDISLDDQDVRTRIRELVNADPAPLTYMEKGILLQKILDELFGFGPLGPLLRDPSVRDIYVYSHDQVHVERVVPAPNNPGGKCIRKGIERTEVSFRDEEHIKAIVARIFKSNGASLSKKAMMNTCTLANGTVVTAVFAPRSNRGAMLIIRSADD